MQIVVVAIVAYVGGLLVLVRWIAVKPQVLADNALRTEWYRYLRTDARIRRIRDATTSDFLLAEAKYLVAGKIDAIKSSEMKASAQLGIVGGGVGLLSVFGTNQTAIIGGYSFWILQVAAFLLFSIVCNVVCIALGSIDALPSLDVYNSEEVNASAEMKGRISVSLTEEYLRYGTKLGALSRRKGRLQKAATVGFVGGVISLAFNYGDKGLHPSVPSPPTYRCVAANMTITCKDVVK